MGRGAAVGRKVLIGAIPREANIDHGHGPTHGGNRPTEPFFRTPQHSTATTSWCRQSGKRLFVQVLVSWVIQQSGAG